MAQKNINLDDDTAGMLEDLVDLDKARDGESNNSKVVRALIRDEHRLEFPDQWNGSYFKSYTRSA